MSSSWTSTKTLGRSCLKVLLLEALRPGMSIQVATTTLRGPGGRGIRRDRDTYASRPRGPRVLTRVCFTRRVTPIVA
jgi:hypothetical protein